MVSQCVMSKTLSAITCSAGLMLHARVPQSLINQYCNTAGVEISPGPGLLSNSLLTACQKPEFGIVTCSLPCGLPGLPYVKQSEPMLTNVGIPALSILALYMQRTRSGACNPCQIPLHTFA